MTKHWTVAQAEACLQDVKDAMFAYARAESEATPCPLQPSPTTTTRPCDPHERANRNLSSGFQGLQDIFESLSRMALGEENDGANGNAENPPNSQEAQDALDRQRVDAEVLRYTVDPNVTMATTSFNILEWWQMHRFSYPLLWKVARDVLPVQASSVPCERVFSSSKHTTGQQRNTLQPGIVEKLQIMKFGLKQDRLNFTVDWIQCAEEMYGGMDYYGEED